MPDEGRKGGLLHELRQLPWGIVPATVALVTALMWVGSLSQRVATMETTVEDMARKDATQYNQFIELTVRMAVLTERIDALINRQTPERNR